MKMLRVFSSATVSKLDAPFGVLRHITDSSACALLCDLDEELAGGSNACSFGRDCDEKVVETEVSIPSNSAVTLV